ncbi:MAG TPA: bacillithiol system redox-active protein YtxJ [Vicinamibacterales bacterium]|nr:bacillithiol system redox-active protein YtxJ [Vicinamibacterales bacterium]
MEAAATLRWMSRLVPLTDLPALDAAILESNERPVLLFKHSRYCGVSAEALDELQSHIDNAPSDIAYRMITVQTHRPLSDAVAQRLGLRHETPQAILLRDGKIVWNASHFRITANQLNQVLNPK